MKITGTTFIDSERGLRQFLLETLPHAPDDVADIKTSDLLIIFWDWQKRLIPVQPRKVHFSSSILSNTLANDDNYKYAYHQIVSDIEEGKDLTRYLSRWISKPTESLDLLLNDWGIHHLHLSTVVESDGFVKRDGPLLFVAFKPNDAYLITIFGHKQWTHESLCQTLVREWPEAELLYEIPEITGHNLTNAERMQYRQQHINVALSIDGKSYFPKGLMSKGNSQDSYTKAQTILDNLRNGKPITFQTSK